jgi:predicted nucleic acid-binding protein
MRILADTNILVRLLNPADPLQALALSALDHFNRRKDDVCLVPQVLYELWVVCTRPGTENGLGLSPADAHAALRQACRFFPLLRDERGVYDRWSMLVVQAEVRGKAAHDARLVAACLATA